MAAGKGDVLLRVVLKSVPLFKNKVVFSPLNTNAREPINSEFWWKIVAETEDTSQM